MKKIVATTLLSLATTATLFAAENSTYIGGITGSSHYKDDFTSSKTSVSGFEFGHHYTGNEGGLFAGKLTLDGSLSNISGKKMAQVVQTFKEKFWSAISLPLQAIFQLDLS